MPGIGDVEEEDVVLALEDAQETTAGENRLVGRRVAVMRLVAGVARRWRRDRSKHLSVLARLAIEVDDREEVRRHARGSRSWWPEASSDVTVLTGHRLPARQHELTRFRSRVCPTRRSLIAVTSTGDARSVVPRCFPKKVRSLAARSAIPKRKVRREDRTPDGASTQSCRR